MTHTITSDEVRCPKCYYNTSDWNEDVVGVWYSKRLECENCSCHFVCETKLVAVCTEVLND